MPSRTANDARLPDVYDAFLFNADCAGANSGVYAYNSSGSYGNYRRRAAGAGQYGPM